jgi:argininosuccinate synthase
MRNLDIADSRAKLEQYAGLGLIGTANPAIGAAQAAATGLIGTMPEMSEGGAEAIASRGEIAGDDEPLDRAAMEFGTD